MSLIPDCFRTFDISLQQVTGMCLQGVADRVLLGLIPSSRTGWGTAIAALKPAGGILHLHENLSDSREAADVTAIMDGLDAEATCLNRPSLFRVLRLERVKWYAPHVRHVVLDIECLPASSPIEASSSSAGLANGVAPTHDSCADNTDTAVPDGSGPSQAAQPEPKQAPSPDQPSAPALGPSRALSSPTAASTRLAGLVNGVGPDHDIQAHHDSHADDGSGAFDGGIGGSSRAAQPVQRQASSPDRPDAHISGPSSTPGSRLNSHGLSSGSLKIAQQATATQGGAHGFQNGHDFVPHQPLRDRVVPVLHAVSAQQFRDVIAPAQRPVILRGLDLGPATQRWTPDYLKSCPSAHHIVSAHVCTEPHGELHGEQERHTCIASAQRARIWDHLKKAQW